MKKNKKALLLSVLALSSVTLISGCQCEFNFGNEYEKLEVEYTADLEFLVGEEWKDNLIKGTATKFDDTKVDVTNEMTIDTSEYNKNVPGKYKIYFGIEEIEVDYEVSVVDKITNTNTINLRLDPVVTNSFKRNNNVLKFEASSTTEYTDYDFHENMVYEDNNGQLVVYYNWKIDEKLVFESWYKGSEAEGDTTLIEHWNYSDSIEETSEYSLDEYITYVLEDAAFYPYEEVVPTINPMDILDLYDTTFDGELTLNNGVYKLTKTYNNQTASLEYSNNVITKYNNIELDFSVEEQTPTISTINELMRPVIEKSYKREDGVLTYRAYNNYYFDDNDNDVYDEGEDRSFEEEVLFIDDNGQITIYTEWLGNSEPIIEMWYVGTEENGSLTYKRNGEVEESDEINSTLLYSAFLLQLSEDLKVYPEIYPIIISNLETVELSGELSDYGDGDYYLSQWQDGELFTLSSSNNVIIEINGASIEFGANVTIPEVPEVSQN